MNPTNPPMIARRVQPRQAKRIDPTPAEVAGPSTLETVAKVVSDVAKIADAVGKLFKTDATPAPRTAALVHSDFVAQPEMLPDTAFGGGGDWGFGGVPELPAMPEPQGWDFSQMLGFDPNVLMGGFDPNMMMGDTDPNAGW
jgi:hypothetical protein